MRPLSPSILLYCLLVLFDDMNVPRSRYNLEAMHAALSSPAVSGLTVYTIEHPEQPCPAYVPGTVPKDKGCVVKQVFGHYAAAQASADSAAAPLQEKDSSSCAGELLYNGICLPEQWPPRIELSREPPTPGYLTSPPDIITIDVGRQLFVDDFLIDSTNNTKRRWYQAKLMQDINPVL